MCKDVFDEELFLEGLMNKKGRDPSTTVERTLLRLRGINDNSLSTSCFDIISPAVWCSESRYRTFAMTCLMQNGNENGNVLAYRVPVVSRTICRYIWLLLMNLKKIMLLKLEAITLPKRDVLPIACGLTEYWSNAAKMISRNSILQYVFCRRYSTHSNAAWWRKIRWWCL